MNVRISTATAISRPAREIGQAHQAVCCFKPAPRRYGSFIVNAAPPPSLFRKSIRPPWALTILFVIGRPSPVPRGFVV
jgi:hypothetical protein